MGFLDIFKPKYRGSCDAIQARVDVLEGLRRQFEQRLLVWWLDAQKQKPRLWVDVTAVSPTTKTDADELYRVLKESTQCRDNVLAEYIQASCPNLSVYCNEHTGHVFISPYRVTKEEHTTPRSVTFNNKHLEIKYAHNNLSGKYNIRIDLRNGISIGALRRIQEHDKQELSEDRASLYITDDNDKTNSIKLPDVYVQWDIPDTTEVKKYIDEVHFDIQSIDVKTTEWVVGDLTDSRVAKLQADNQPMPQRVAGDNHVLIRLAVDKKQQEEVDAKKAVIADFLKQED